MENHEDLEWTSVRRGALVAVLEQILPLAGKDAAEDTADAEAVSRYVVQTFTRPEYAPYRPFVLALLDELEELEELEERTQGRGFAALEAAEREKLLRDLEGGGDPYLLQAICLVLQIGLEGHLGDPVHGANLEGRAWVALGLTPEGPNRRLKRGVDVD